MTKVTDPKWSYDSGGARVSFTVPSIADAQQICDSFKPGKEYEMEVRVQRKKRSKNANDLLWEMCTRIAEKISTKDCVVDKDEIYRRYIRNVGVFEDVDVAATADKAEKLMEVWSKNGTGWVSEKVDFIPGKEIPGAVKVRLYYGSSTYDTKEMGRLLDAVLQDAKALGIDTLSEADRALLEQYPMGQR